MSSNGDPALRAWDKHERETRNKDEHEMRRLEYESETSPRRRCFHGYVLGVSVVTSLSLLLMAVGQIVGVALDEFDPVSLILRFYIILLCVLGIFVEMEWSKMARSKILKIWVTRGLFYAFVGVLGVQQNRTALMRNENRVGDIVAAHFMNVVAYIMVGFGMLYLIMGTLCLQFFYERQRQEWDKRRERAGIVRETTARFGDGGVQV